MIFRGYLTAILVALSHSSAFADDFQPKIAAHLVPTNAVIEISKTRTAVTAEGRSVQVVCGVVTVRKDPGNWATRTFAYVVDDDKLWLTGMEEWLKEPQKDDWVKEPQKTGVVQVMRYCPGN